MSNVLIESTEELADIKNLLAKNLPCYRKAYSDRSAWLMSFISELAYIKFNPVFKDASKTRFIEKVSELVEGKGIESLSTLVGLVDYDADEERKRLVDHAAILNLKLVKTFDTNGTQAIVLANDTYLFLGFRGTEVTSIKDIKSDFNFASKMAKTGGKIHQGFDQAFRQIAVELQQFLDNDEYKAMPLFITGHSLGGALATVAAKELIHQAGIAACYTFGSPRVGNVKWAVGIKTPIYRLVNALDPVTMLPTSDVFKHVLNDELYKALSQIPVFGSSFKKSMMAKLSGYYHCGDMKYLTVCKPGDYDDVDLLYSVDLIFRVKTFLKNNMMFGKIPSDHSISVYRKKLSVIALRKN